MKRRLAIVLVGFALWASAIAARLYDLQVLRHDEFVRRAERQQQRVIELAPPRGAIFDAKGRELAVSLEVESAFAVPREIGDTERVANLLAAAANLDAGKLARSLAADREFVWVARKLDPPQARAVKALNLPGIYFLEESKRYYPLREIAAQALGYVGVDNRGLAGVEAVYDAMVAGRPGRRTVLRDARRGMAAAPDLAVSLPEPGIDLHLTIDAALEEIAESELASAIATSGASSGSVVLLDPRSGAIRALASYPTFDPNRFADSPEESWRLRAVSDAYEPGSTFKMVTAAAALEEGLVTPDEVFDCEMGGITLLGQHIADHHPFGLLRFRDVIAKSSNVGTIKTALRVANKDFYQTIRGFGFGRTTGVDLPGESAGLLMPVERWAPLAKAYMAFGQGLSVTPLQLASAFAVVANGGALVTPYIVDRLGDGEEATALHPQPTVRGRPVSDKTLATLVELLAGVTREGGTGTAAVPAGYRVVGKTGTAEKAVAGKGYVADDYIASFVGFVPAREPAFVALVVLDSPRGARFHGGDYPAHAFEEIARRALLYLDVLPERDAPRTWPGEREKAPAILQVAAATSGDRLALAGRATSARSPELVSADAVPDLAGLTAREAVARLAKLHLRPVLVGFGNVASQDPPAGSPLPAAGAEIELQLGSGGAGG